MKIIKIIALARETANSVLFDSMLKGNDIAKKTASDILNNLQSIPNHILDMSLQDFTYIMKSCTNFLRNYYVFTADTVIVSVLFGYMGECITTLNQKGTLAGVHWAIWDLAKNVSILQAHHFMPLLDLLNTDPSGDTLYAFINFAIKDDATFLDFVHVLKTYGILS